MIHFNTGNVQIAFGGQYSLLTRYLKSFMDRLRKSDAELVLFFVAKKITDEAEIHIPAAEGDYMEALDVLDKINKSGALGIDRAVKECIRIPVAFGYNAFRLSKQFSEVKINYARHNQEIAKYLNENKDDVLAVLSNDTDFAAFEGDFQFWKVNDLSMKEMTAMRVNRDAVLKKLSLNHKQIQLVSALSYGSLLTFDVMKQFYLDIRSPGVTKSRFMHLVNYVQSQPCDDSQKDPRKAFDLKTICAEVFGKNNTEHELNAVENGFLQYNLAFKQTADPVIPVLKLMREKNPFMYQLFNDKVFIIRDYKFIDFRFKELKSYTELIFPLVRKMQGILYANSNNNIRPKSRLVCMKHAHDEPFKITDEIIAYPNCKSASIVPHLIAKSKSFVNSPSRFSDQIRFRTSSSLFSRPRIAASIQLDGGS